MSRLPGCLAAAAALAALAAAGWVRAANRAANASEVYAPEDGAPGAFADIGGFRLHYRLLGDPSADRTGAPALLVHGFSVAGGAEWARLAPLLAGGRSVIVPDLLGFGHSERVAAPTPAYSHRGQAALLAGLLDALGVRQADVVGASYGGSVAAQLALDAPGRVRRLALVDAQAYEAGGGVFQKLGTLPLGLGRAFVWSALGAGPGGDRLMRLECGSGGYCPDEAEVALRRRLASIRGTTDALRGFNSAPLDVRLPAELGGIRAPTLVLWGERDTLVPLTSGRRLAADIPGARIVTFPETGHTPHLQRPAEVARELLAFFGGADE